MCASNWPYNKKLLIAISTSRRRAGELVHELGTLTTKSLTPRPANASLLGQARTSPLQPYSTKHSRIRSCPKHNDCSDEWTKLLAKAVQQQLSDSQ